MIAVVDGGACPRARPSSAGVESVDSRWILTSRPLRLSDRSKVSICAGSRPDACDPRSCDPRPATSHSRPDVSVLARASNFVRSVAVAYSDTFALRDVDALPVRHRFERIPELSRATAVVPPPP